MSVYKCINAVQESISGSGITKDRKNKQQGWSFRGIDDVYNALSPLLSKHGLCILPRVLAHTQSVVQTRNGGTMNYTILDCEFDFVCAEDGSKHTVRVFGEAADSGDKSTNKALSIAYKYACFLVFSIPTEGDNDPDYTATPHAINPWVADLQELSAKASFNLEDYAKKANLNSSLDIPYEWVDSIKSNLLGRIENIEAR